MPEDHRAALLRAIAGADHPLDDDELSQRTGIRPRQTVNQVLRRLAADGVVRRWTGHGGKLVTGLLGNPGRPAPLPLHSHAEPDDLDGGAAADTSIDRLGTVERPPGSSQEQRDAERVMLELLGRRLGRELQPARIVLKSGVRVEIDGADEARELIVECWAHQGPPKGGQRHKVLTDALKLTWIGSTMYPRPEMVLCMSDAAAAAPFQPSSMSWAAQALQDLGIRVEVVELPEELRDAVMAAQKRQYR